MPSRQLDRQQTGKKKAALNIGRQSALAFYNIEHFDLNAEWEWCSITNASPQHRYVLTF